MQKINRIILFVVVAVLILGGYFLYRNSQKIAEAPGQEVAEETIIEEVNEEDLVGSPINIVTVFITNFVKSAPPEDNEEVSQALDEALAALTEDAKGNLEQTEGNYTSGSLAKFIGVQDIPDVGFTVSEISRDEVNGTARVNALLEYTGGNTDRFFTLKNIDGEWKIDSVETLSE